jgi:hypothetical protein
VKVWHVLLIAGLIFYFAPNRYWRLAGMTAFILFFTIVAPGGT